MLYFAQQNRQKIDSAHKRDKIELASIAARETFLSDLKRVDMELTRNSTWLRNNWEINGNHRLFVKQFIPLLAEDELIESLRFANEEGLEFAIIDKQWEFISCETSPGASVSDTCYRWSKTDLSNIEFLGGTENDETSDPRSNTWFANAIRSSGNTSWTFQKRDAHNYLIGSLLVGPKSESDQLTVIAMEVNASKVISHMRKVPSRIGAITFLRLPDGSDIYPNDLRDPEVTSELARETVESIGRESYNRVFDMTLNGRAYKVGYRPIHIEGTDPLLITLVPMEPEKLWLPINPFVITGYIIVLLLALLLFISWRRRSIDSRKIRVHEQRSISQQQQLRQALDEREVLDREVHHRVKNNLQIISSLLNMQRMRLSHEETIATFDQSKERIEAIAQIHNAIYRSKDLRGIDLQDFLDAVIKWVHQRLAPKVITISYDVQANAIKADMDTSLDIGIIVAELVTNCYKHAFPYVTGGHVDVTLSHLELDRYMLIVQDNGRGMSADLLETDKANRLGLDLVEALVEGLDGTFSYRSDNGVRFEAVFNIVPREPSGKPL